MDLIIKACMFIVGLCLGLILFGWLLKVVFYIIGFIIIGYTSQKQEVVLDSSKPTIE